MSIPMHEPTVPADEHPHAGHPPLTMLGAAGADGCDDGACAAPPSQD